MATSSGLGFYRLPCYSLQIPIRHCCYLRVRLCHAAAIEALDDTEVTGNVGRENAFGKTTEWKKLKSKDLGISTSKISRETKFVLNGLKRRGFDVYLVGGCVRDLILKRTPKDFDIITSADLKEVMRTFSRCEKVGRRFPICHVHIDDTTIEVSSFSTQATGKIWSLDLEKPVACDEKDFIRWRNCLQRDFTINGLLFDPFEKLVYDYMGGVKDIRNAKVRTIIPANLSLTEDCARILRAIRIAARLDFQFSKETAVAIRLLSPSVMRLDRGRLLMEVNYMLAYGSGEASLRLLWKLGLLEILLPIQAAYFVRDGFRRRDKRYNMLLALFSNLDKHLAPDRPCHSSLWCAILAFHAALTERHRNPVVISTFVHAISNSGDLSKAYERAIHIHKHHDASFHEISKTGNADPDAILDEVMSLASSVRTALTRMTDEYFVSHAMARYPKAPFSDLVLFPMTLYLRVLTIFECVGGRMDRRFISKHGSKIDYDLLAMGSLREVRNVFARVVIDTIYPVDDNRIQKSE